MLYQSTRGQVPPVSAAQAILAGIAPNGGLFVPQEIPAMPTDWLSQFLPMNYCQRAQVVLQLFLTDYSPTILAQCLEEAYGADKFDDPHKAPVRVLSPVDSVLELWHGPTSAFKDMALQLLPRLVSAALNMTKTEQELVVLTATSGDTGKAALEGFRDVPRTRVMVFYPEGGVSAVQRLQMVTQEGKNVAVGAIQGNFDQAQAAVKEIFNDAAFEQELAERGYRLSSANSINWGRLVPQIVYYFSAYADLVKQGAITEGEEVNFAVPTGNFGDILAGWYAKEMGLPVNCLICAANDNHVLADFFKTGQYDRNRPFQRTTSPSMDILISSNLERLLYHATQDDQITAEWMDQLGKNGNYNIPESLQRSLRQSFWSDWCSQQEVTDTIQHVYQTYKYLCDPHTAVAWAVGHQYRKQSGDGRVLVTLSTASPYKFSEAVMQAVGQYTRSADEFSLLYQLEKLSGMAVPAPLAALERQPQRHEKCLPIEEMRNFIREQLI